MDRKKEDIDQLNKEKTILSTTSTTIKNTKSKLGTPTDDDASTESSDTFDSWTLVNDKEKTKFQNNLENNSENRLEILKSDDSIEDHKKIENNSEKELQLQDSLNDDISDGISIISESESAGRASPHPYIRDHLHDLNTKFCLSDHMDDSILNKMREEMENDDVPLLVEQLVEPTANQQLRQRRTTLAAPADGNHQALQNTSKTVITSNGLVPLVKRGFQSIFYLCVGLALLGLIGKIVNPTWQPLTKVVNSLPSTLDLEQKINDMELQNNLMRAEIDLLNKQVKYLSTLNDPQQQKPTKYKNHKDGKFFKAWTGNGDSLKPVDITKRDLRNPYKCSDGSFVEIANMCIEKSPANEPSIVDQFGQVMEDLKEQSAAFKTFEEAAEVLQDLQDKPFEQLQDIFSEQLNTEVPTKQFFKNKPISETTKEYKESFSYTQKYQTHPTNGEEPTVTKQYKENKYDKVEGKNDDKYKLNNEYKKSFGKDVYKQNKEYKKYSDKENFRDTSNERNEWKNDKVDNNFKERKYRKDNSKERYNKDFNDSKEYSKERNYKQKRKNDDDSGEWQEKYMKHREQQRKQNEQKYQDNKNWYIKRGDSREIKRGSEKIYR